MLSVGLCQCYPSNEVIDVILIRKIGTSLFPRQCGRRKTNADDDAPSFSESSEIASAGKIDLMRVAVAEAGQWYYEEQVQWTMQCQDTGWEVHSFPSLFCWIHHTELAICMVI